MTCRSVNLAKSGPIRQFLNLYRQGRPRTLAECARGKRLATEEGLFDNVVCAIRNSFYNYIKHAISKEISNKRLAEAFVSEMENIIATMGIKNIYNNIM